MPKWYEIKALARAEGEPKAADVYVYGNIGDKWDADGVIAADMVRDVSALDVDTINLRINSYGGSVSDGMAIYNALKRHKALVHAHIDGVALSIAGYIAMAGDKITMAKNAQMMIHAPWGLAVGNARKLRQEADKMDRWAKGLASGYADKSGQTHDDVMSLLMDGEDHWYTPDEAVEAGFADEIGEEITVAAALASSFDLSRFKPAAAAAQPKEALMPEPVNPAAQPAIRSTEDNQKVVAMFKPFADRSEILALQTSVLTDTKLTVEQIQARLLDTLGKDAAPANPSTSFPKIETVGDETDKFRAAAADALLVRAGVVKSKERNPFASMTCYDLAAHCLSRIGAKASFDREDNIKAAFTQGTSDFPIILENAMHKALQIGYELEEFTWSRFCAQGSLSDLRPHGRYRMSSLGTLDPVNELGEFVNKTIADGEKATIQGSTKGNIINVSAETIINDDLGAFVGLASRLGRAGSRTVEQDVYALLALNSGLGPVLWDGQTLFHATHGNIGSSSVLGIDTIDADRVLMARQMDVGSNDFLAMRPSVLLVATELGAKAREVNAAEYNDESNKQQRRPNTTRGLFRDIVDTPRLSGNRRYLFADPQLAPVIEVAFLNGQGGPDLKMEEGFDVDGTRWRVRMRYGVAAVDYRGTVTNAGG